MSDELHQTLTPALSHREREKNFPPFGGD